MYREIRKKKLILENRKPYSREAQHLIEDLGKTEWIHSSLVLDGYKLTRPVVERMLKGEFFPQVSVGDHLVVNNFSQAIDTAYAMIDMGNELSKSVMLKLLVLISGGNDRGYRENNPVLRMLSYNPPHFKEIDNQMDLLFQKYHREKAEENPIKVAACLHNGLIEIYPYENYSEAVARMAASYHLIAVGFPLVAWNMSEQEYYEALRLYLKSENIEPIHNMLERSIFNSLEVMLQLTAE